MTATFSARAVHAPLPPPTRARAMMRRYNRLLVAFFVLTDAFLGIAAFISPTRSASRPA